MENKQVFVIIVHYNNPQDCTECVDHVLAQSHEYSKILIVDNNSDVLSLASIKDHLSTSSEHRFYSERAFSKTDISEWKKINLIQCAHNHGYGKAVNVALKGLLGSKGYFFLLNPDINLDPNTIESLIRCGENKQAIYGCEVYNEKRPDQIRYLAGFKIHKYSGTISFITHMNMLSQIDAVSGGCLFAPIAVIDEVGYFPTDYFLYWEDADWCHRAKERGIELRLCPNAKAFDKGSTTIGKGYLAEYYYSYNALMFSSKMSQRYWPFILLSNTLRAVKKLLEFRYSNFHAILKSSYHYLMHRADHPNRK